MICITNYLNSLPTKQMNLAHTEFFNNAKNKMSFFEVEQEISVVMATYNGELYIDQQIRSILSQLGSDDEIIISDDHSTDNTISLIESFQDSRIKLVFPTVARGPIANFEHGLTHATKEVVVLSDQDDVWLPGRIAAIRSYFNKSYYPFDLLILNSRVVNEELETIEPSVFQLLHSGPGLLKNIFRNTYIGCHMAFRRSLLSAALPFPRCIPMHDVWLGLVSELMGEVTFCDEPSMLFRRTGKNFTKARYSWKTRISWRFNLMFGLLCFALFRRKKVLSTTLLESL